MSASREQFTAVRGEGVSYRLELTQRAAIAIVLTALGGIAILDYFEIGLGLFASLRAPRGSRLPSAGRASLGLVRHRQGPSPHGVLLMGAATVTCIYADDVLLVAALAVGITSAGYLAAQFVGFLLPVRRQPRIDVCGNKCDLGLRLDFEHVRACRGPAVDPQPVARLAKRQTAFGWILLVPAIVSEARAERCFQPKAQRRPFPCAPRHSPKRMLFWNQALLQLHDGAPMRSPCRLNGSGAKPSAWSVPRRLLARRSACVQL